MAETVITLLISFILLFYIGNMAAILNYEYKKDISTTPTTVVLFVLTYIYLGLIHTLEYLGTPEYHPVLYIAAGLSAISFAWGFLSYNVQDAKENEGEEEPS